MLCRRMRLLARGRENQAGEAVNRAFCESGLLDEAGALFYPKSQYERGNND